MQRIVIAIDGPAGAGKSTIAKLISKDLNLIYIDTGAMYRAVTLMALENKINEEDVKSLLYLIKNTQISFKDNKLYLNDICKEDDIRTNEVSSNVSKYAAIKEVREILVEKQRDMAKEYSVIMDGRDIATHVLVDANYKFYLTASPKIRGERRYKELIEKGENISLEKIIEDIKKRDFDDMNREVSPLVKAKDAILVDTDNMSISEVVKNIIGYIK
ncbi:MAG: (d)CMP kinase [Peptostreptococcaceae bacterium]|jgi:cytidylate kinase|nr:(d)CMP kinase [Peptostreptococcaceae bacterium]